MRSVYLAITMLVLICSAGPAFSAEYALDKGSILISGTTGATFSNQSGDLWESNGKSRTTFVFNPSLMFFALPNYALGGMMEITYITQGADDMSSFAIGPTFVTFFGTESAEIYPFVGGSLAYLNFGNGTTIDGFQLEVNGGATFMAGKHIGIVGEMSVAFTTLGAKGYNSESGTTIMLRFGVIGFIF